MGRDKAFLDAGGIPMIDYILYRLRPVARDIIIAAREPERFDGRAARVVVDQIETPSPLAGIHAVLRAAREDAVFVCGVDLPCINERLIRHLYDRLESFDAVLPQGEAGIEPLYGIYTRACIVPIEASAAAGRLKITEAVSSCNVQALPVRESDWLVDGLSPFTNLNNPGEYDVFRQRMSNLF